jgi:hypothetical protein
MVFPTYLSSDMAIAACFSDNEVREGSAEEKKKERETRDGENRDRVDSLSFGVSAVTRGLITCETERAREVEGRWSSR